MERSVLGYVEPQSLGRKGVGGMVFGTQSLGVMGVWARHAAHRENVCAVFGSSQRCG